MAKQRKKPSAERGLFLFSYHEHQWVGEIEGQEEAEQAYLQQAAGEWEPVKVKTAREIDNHCDPDVESIENLMDHVRVFLVDESGMSDAVVELPFEKLRALIARDGWKFVSGTFFEFEGNHNDSEIHVVLEK